MHWQFDHEGWASLTPATEITPPIQLRQSSNGHLMDIEQRDCRQSHRTLGVMENPSMDYSDHKKYLQSKGKSLALHLSASQVNPTESWVAYRSIYLASMRYSLAATSFSQWDFNHIQSFPIQCILNKMGYHCSMPRTVVFGPTSMGGLRFTHLYSSQGSQQALSLLRHICHNSNLGKLMRVALSWFQLTAGVSFPVLLRPSLHLPHAVGIWFLLLRAFLDLADCSIYIKDCPVVHPRHEGDLVLMDFALELSLTDAELCSINQVRLFLQVKTLSDISNAAGTHLTGTVWDSPPIAPSRSTHKWP